MKKFCKYCGANIDADSIFCSSCGSKLETSSDDTFKRDITTSIADDNSVKDLEQDKDEYSEQGKRLKYDYSHPRETFTASVGILLLIIHLVVLLLLYYVPEIIHPVFWLAYKIYTIVLLRIIVLIWVGNIAQRLNRNGTSWKIFGFIMPTIALIMIGYKRKLIKYGDIPEELLSKIKIEEADEYYDDKYGKITSFLVTLDTGESGFFYRRKSDKRFYINENGRNVFFNDKKSCVEQLYLFINGR